MRELAGKEEEPRRGKREMRKKERNGRSERTNSYWKGRERERKAQQGKKVENRRKE